EGEWSGWHRFDSIEEPFGSERDAPWFCDVGSGPRRDGDIEVGPVDTDASVLVGLDEAAGEDGERRFLGADALDAEQHVTECVTIDCELHRLAFSDMFHGQRTDHLSSLMVHLQKRQLLLLLVYGSESKDSAHSSNRGCGFVYKSRKCLISG